MTVACPQFKHFTARWQHGHSTDKHPTCSMCGLKTSDQMDSVERQVYPGL